MRVLHVIPRYAPARGGAEAHMAEFSRRLAAHGHEVTVATTDAQSIEALWMAGQPRLEQQEEMIDGVRVLRFPIEPLPFSALSFAAIRRLLWLLSRLAAPIPLLWRLARYAPRVPALWHWVENTEERFDLVAGMGIAFESIVAAGLRYALQWERPHLIYPLTHLGAGDRPGQDGLSAFYTMRHQVALVRQSTVAFMQTASEQAYYRQHGLPLSRLPVIGSGVTPEEVLGGRAAAVREKYQVRGPIILSLGAMSYDKGTFHLVEAVQQLWQRGVDVELFLAGAILETFRQHLAQLPAAARDRLHVLGPVDEQEKKDLLAACDLFVLPSRTDSFGIVYLEAWLYRKPVIGANSWGVCDVITDGSDGLLVPFANVHALSSAIEQLLADPDMAAAMGAAGERKVYDQHQWPAKFEQAHAIYKQAVQ